MTSFTISAGRPNPLGATFDGDGVNFAVYSEHATRVTLCLFDERGNETVNIDLPECEHYIWHGHVGGIRPGQLYGYRVSGPYQPEFGFRFNPHKLLMDPYAKRLSGHPKWDDSLFGYIAGSRDKDLSYDRRDSAPFAPRSVVADPSFAWDDDHPPKVPIAESVIYEAHVKGLTAQRRDIDNAGTYLAMSSEPVLEHLVKLGVTTVELLPVHASLSEQHLLRKGLSNYWGYMTLGFFAPDPRFAIAREIAEFQQMVARFHSAGIEVILDVVYNHTAEGNQLGPTLSFRGLDNTTYYRLAENRRHYVDDTGTGNTLNTEHPMVMRMVMDSLRYWVEVMHVDGFRFDLASTLGRRSTGFDRQAPFFTALRQDPVLAGVKLIAEPWDTGPGGYQLGNFPAPFLEWNDKFRDQIRRLWRGDSGHVRKLATRLAGSALRFDHSGRPATSSVNFLTAHDGFTLMDLVSYNDKHNEANGEDNRDGHSHNSSDNCGVEGPTDDPEIVARRARRRRNLLATLLLSQGTPMLLAGDELGNSQSGNNNAYCQDNEIGWVDWSAADPDFLEFCCRIVAFRRRHPILRQSRFLHSKSREFDGVPDLFWLDADGRVLSDGDWSDDGISFLGVELRMAAGTPEYAPREDIVYLAFNLGDEPREARLPEAPEARKWRRAIDTDDPQGRGEAAAEGARIEPLSVAVFVLDSE